MHNAIANEIEVGKAYNEIGNYKQATNYLQKAVRYGIRSRFTSILYSLSSPGKQLESQKRMANLLKKSPNGKYAKRIKRC